MLNTAMAALFAVSQLVPGGAADEVDVQASIEVVTVNGSGCRAGDADVSTSGRTFTVGYHTFLASAGGDSAPTDFRKNCQINVRVDAPDGFTYGIGRVENRGFVHLQAGSTGLQRSTVYYQGGSQDTSVNRTFTGPITDDFQVDYRPPSTDVVWVPCGAQRNLNVNIEARVTVTDRDRFNFLFLEETRGTVRFKRC